MDIFLEKFNPPQLHWEEIEIMNNSIRSKVIEAVVKNLKTNKQRKKHTQKNKNKKIKSQDQMALQKHPIKHLEKS